MPIFMMSRLITKHDKRFNNQTNQSEAKLNSSFSHDKTGVDKAKSSTSPNSRAAVDWKKLFISSKDINYKTYHCNYCHLCWFIHVRILWSSTTLKTFIVSIVMIILMKISMIISIDHLGLQPIGGPAVSENAPELRTARRNSKKQSGDWVQW